MNRLACLRLTERCADILLSIREEIVEAGNDVVTELQRPIIKLVECVHKPRVYNVLFIVCQKQGICPRPCSDAETSQPSIHQEVFKT